ncbi:MAG: DedA family protein [Vicinamibacteria bacterium]|nr:DedA family protein [Vicinamibacteria bacterium]
MIDALLDWLAGLPATGQYAALMLLSAIENVFPPVPADVAVALGAFLARRGEVSAPLLGVLCWLANCASSTGVFWLARAKGDDFLASHVGRALVSQDAQKAVHDAYEKWGVVGIFLSRFLPVFRAAVLPVAGAVGLSPLRALPPAFAASACWYAMLITVGLALGASWDAVRHQLDVLNHVLSVVAVVTSVALAAALWRALRHPR